MAATDGPGITLLARRAMGPERPAPGRMPPSGRGAWGRPGRFPYLPASARFATSARYRLATGSTSSLKS